MPIFHDSKSIFVHITKCGGTTVEQLFFPTEQKKPDNLWAGIGRAGFNKYGESGGLQHLSAQTIKQAVAKKTFEEYFKFTFVRDPWSRAVSQYFYTKGREDLQKWIGLKKNFSFADYLRGILDSPNHVQFQPQHEFIYNDGKLLVDFVGRLENIKEDINHICRVLEIPLPSSIPQANGRPRDYKIRYGPEEKKLVLKKYEKDFELLDYSPQLTKFYERNNY